MIKNFRSVWLVQKYFSVVKLNNSTGIPHDNIFCEYLRNFNVAFYGFTVWRRDQQKHLRNTTWGRRGPFAGRFLQICIPFLLQIICLCFFDYFLLIRDTQYSTIGYFNLGSSFTEARFFFIKLEAGSTLPPSPYGLLVQLCNVLHI